MKIRRHLNNDETLSYLDDYEEIFLGSCCGVALVKRGKNDNHICFIHLTEDDDNWFPRGNPMSSFWLEDEMNVLNAVKEWLSKNADPDLYNGNQFGWKFKVIP